MAKVTVHFVRGNNPEKFASTLANFMGKVYFSLSLSLCALAKVLLAPSPLVPSCSFIRSFFNFAKI